MCWFHPYLCSNTIHISQGWCSYWTLQSVAYSLIATEECFLLSFCQILHWKTKSKRIFLANNSAFNIYQHCCITYGAQNTKKHVTWVTDIWSFDQLFRKAWVDRGTSAVVLEKFLSRLLKVLLNKILLHCSSQSKHKKSLKLF